MLFFRWRPALFSLSLQPSAIGFSAKRENLHLHDRDSGASDCLADSLMLADKVI